MRKLLSNLVTPVLALLCIVGTLGLGLQTWEIRELRGTLQEAQKQAQEASQEAREYQRSLGSLKAATEALIQSTQASQAALAYRAERAAQEQADAQKELHALRQALKESPEWASSPIPSAIADSLR